MKLPMFEDSAGERSFTMTAAVLALGVVLVKYLVAGISVLGFIGGPYPDGLLTSGILAATLGSYVMRRNEIGVKAQPLSGAAAASGGAGTGP